MAPRLASVRRLLLVAAFGALAPAAARAQVAGSDSAARAQAADSARVRFMADSIVRAQLVADSLARVQAAADSAFRVWSAAVARERARVAADSVAADSATRASLATDSTPRPPRSFADTASRFGVDGTRLTPGEWRYAVAVSADSQTQPLGERDVVLSRGMYGPMPAWLLVASGGRGALRALDSLYVDALTLKALHWGTRLGAAKVGAAFALDTIFGAAESPLGKQNIVLPKPGRLVVNAEMLETVLRLEPLAMGWRDSVMILLTEPTAAVTTPAQLTVSGEEQVTTPAGTFDCWLVDVSAPSGQSRLWVSKTDQVVVKAVQAVPQLGATATVQRVLVAVGPRPPAPAPLAMPVDSSAVPLPAGKPAGPSTAPSTGAPTATPARTRPGTPRR